MRTASNNSSVRMPPGVEAGAPGATAISRDCRAAEDHGVSSLQALPEFDTELPQNIGDSDLWPEMREMPHARPDWTAMTLGVVVAEICQVWRRVSMLLSSPISQEAKEARRCEELRALREKIKNMLQRCNPVVPMQKMTVDIAEFVFHKMDFITRQQLGVGWRTKKKM